jgi:tRNA pseudouridine38-40 synthase
MNYFLEIKYDGGPYHGWQIQPNANTIQHELEKALTLVFGQKISISGSSRTDTGVHARQQYAQFTLPFFINDTNKLTLRLNKLLPQSIAIKNIFLLPENAHCRFDAVSRKYIYRIIKQKDPFIGPFAAVYHQNYCLDTLNQAAQLLLEYTDFEAFSKVKTDVKTFNCEIEYAMFLQNDTVLEFQIKANRFLRGMVRAIVGTLLEVGLKKISINDFKNIIESKNRNLAGMAAKAEGLCLEEVNYPENYFMQEIIVSKAEKEEMPIIRELFIEYQEFLGFSLCFQGFEQELETLPFPYQFPEGEILIARLNGYVVGVVALKKIESGVCEMKRLYVKPAARGLGIGNQLVTEILKVSKDLGYRLMKLDTLERLKAAVKLYNDFGFSQTKPYNYNPETDILYFEKEL